MKQTNKQTNVSEAYAAFAQTLSVTTYDGLFMNHYKLLKKLIDVLFCICGNFETRNELYLKNFFVGET